MGQSLRHAVEDCARNRRPEEVGAFRMRGQVRLAQQMGRHVAIVRNADVKAVLAHRNTLLDAARDAHAALMLAEQSGDDGVAELLAKLKSAIGAAERAS